MRSAIGTRRQFPNWFYVAAQLVWEDDTWCAEPLDQHFQEAPCSSGVPPGLNQNVEHLTVRVDGAPEPVFRPADRDDDLIEMPLTAGVGSHSSDLTSSFSQTNKPFLSYSDTCERGL